MTMDSMIESKLFIALVSVLIGILATITTKFWLNRRSVFSYTASHSPIGISADDKIYGTVKVTWNDEPIIRLFLTRIDIENISSNDFENIKILIFTGNTYLLTQRTEISNTTEIIHFSEEYKEKIEVSKEKEPSDEQYELYRNQREYIVPVMNRGQKIVIELLNAVKTDEEPEIWVEILQKGIVCKYRIEQPQFFGIPQYSAAYVGTFLGLFCVLILLTQTNNLWVVAILSYFIGILAIIPGAVAIKAFKTIRDWITG